MMLIYGVETYNVLFFEKYKMSINAISISDIIDVVIN